MAQTLGQYGRSFAEEVMISAADLAIVIHRDAEPSDPDGEPQSELFFECLLLSTHVADRFAFAQFGFTGRELFIDALAEKLVEGGTAAEFVPAMNAAQRHYELYRDIVPESGHQLIGTLTWEFAKALVLRFWPSRPELMLLAHFHTNTVIAALGERFFQGAPPA